MSIDLSEYDSAEHKHCLTAREINRHADLFQITYLCTDNRLVVGHLVTVASDLMAASQRLIEFYLTDGYDITVDVQTGLSETERFGVLTLASTCAYNAVLYLQEAQRRRVTRSAESWDPFTDPTH